LIRSVALVVAMWACGCREPIELPVGHDLSSPTYYCPTRPPVDGEYDCDPTAIPFCGYPDLELTCTCAARPGGDGHALYCGEVPDGGGA
jgi:hypothetical protein